ncbi:hypothetical protein GCM10023405_32310 [Streptomonospora salina]
MAWDVGQDADHYRIAYHLQRDLGPRWLVMWGPGSHAFWAFYRGPSTVRPLSAPTPQRLLDHIHTTERHVAAGMDPYDPCRPDLRRPGADTF